MDDDARHRSLGAPSEDYGNKVGRENGHNGHERTQRGLSVMVDRAGPWHHSREFGEREHGEEVDEHRGEHRDQEAKTGDSETLSLQHEGRR